jgi:hypothetical protein
MAYRFMREHKSQYAIRETAGVFGAVSGAYYKRGHRKKRNRRDAEPVRFIREIMKEHHGRYGSSQVRNAAG